MDNHLCGYSGTIQAMQSSSTTATYDKMLASIDESIQMLTTKREGLLASYRQSRMSDILEQDAAWLADAKAAPRDWAHLLSTKTANREWIVQVALEGVTGNSEWAYSDERAIRFQLYTEVPERMDLFAWLIEELVPFMKPWSSSTTREPCRFFTIYNQGNNLLLGKTEQNTWTLSGPGGRNPEAYPDLKSALKAAQKIAARSFFHEES